MESLCWGLGQVEALVELVDQETAKEMFLSPEGAVDCREHTCNIVVWNKKTINSWWMRIFNTQTKTWTIRICKHFQTISWLFIRKCAEFQIFLEEVTIHLLPPKNVKHKYLLPFCIRKNHNYTKASREIQLTISTKFMIATLIPW